MEKFFLRANKKKKEYFEKEYEKNYYHLGDNQEKIKQWKKGKIQEYSHSRHINLSGDEITRKRRLI